MIEYESESGDFTGELISFTSFLAEHPGSEPQGEDSRSGHVHGQQEEGEETLEEKP